MAYVKFELEDGTIIFIESAETQKGTSGLIPGSRGEHAADLPAIAFDQSFDAVRKMAGAMLHTLQSGLEELPEEVSISFGLKASGELGSLVIGRGGMEANYNVSIRWRRTNEKENEKKDNGAASAQPAAAESSTVKAVGKSGAKAPPEEE